VPDLSIQQVPDDLVQKWVTAEYIDCTIERFIFAMACMACLGVTAVPGLGWARLVPAAIAVFCGVIAVRNHFKAAYWRPMKQALAGNLKATRTGDMLLLENPQGAWGEQQVRLRLTPSRIAQLEQAAARALPAARVVRQ